MTDRFDHIFETLIGHEGGYVNDPRDPGGETKFGISKKSYPNVDIAALTLEEAKAIYARDFWAKPKIDQIADDGLAEKVFDIAVNCGAARAGRFLQEAANEFGAHQPATRLVHTVIENLPALKLIERYDSPETLFYLDPPYYSEPCYNFNMALFDYECLAAKLAKIKGRFVLSINDHPAMREVFLTFNIKPVELKYSVNNKENKLGKELIITNF